uniref:Uncharacterized protein n=1 Tax=Arundo donax TaxID=35708 RepID=A0A0A8YXN3_ARUDO
MPHSCFYLKKQPRKGFSFEPTRRAKQAWQDRFS